MVIPVVHAITTDAIVARSDFIASASQVMHALGSRGAGHIRAHRLPARHLLAVTEALAPRQGETGAWLVVNDRVDMALIAGALGAQLTSRSLATLDAQHVRDVSRRPVSLGVSVHSVEEARAASDAGVDWLVAGHVFATPSHGDAPGRGLEVLADICRATAAPVIAIGGVRPEHVAAIHAAGAYGVAALRGIWDDSDAAAACYRYLSAHDDSAVCE
jgi:thiazole tautomerase (transcriptional regulator TenI)